MNYLKFAKLLQNLLSLDIDKIKHMIEKSHLKQAKKKNFEQFFQCSAT